MLHKWKVLLLEISRGKEDATDNKGFNIYQSPFQHLTEVGKLHCSNLRGSLKGFETYPLLVRTDYTGGTGWERV